MSGIIDKRKRSREDDICDSTPLSKRINQLHLTNFDEAHQHSQQVTTASQQFDDHNKQLAMSQFYNNNNSNNSWPDNDMNMEPTVSCHNKHLMVTDAAGQQQQHNQHQHHQHQQQHHEQVQLHQQQHQEQLHHHHQQQQQHHEQAQLHQHQQQQQQLHQQHQQQLHLPHNLYDPELSETENPFYYIKNKLLHDLHFERLKRCSV